MLQCGILFALTSGMKDNKKQTTTTKRSEDMIKVIGHGASINNEIITETVSKLSRIVNITVPTNSHELARLLILRGVIAKLTHLKMKGE